jgi:hypothetical protein
MDKEEQKQTIKDLIANEEWMIEYHTKCLTESKIKLNALRNSDDKKQPLDVDKMLRERKYHV